MNILKGLIITLKHIFKRKFTIQYPEIKKTMPARARWRHILQRYDEDGFERCIGCMLCAGACPNDAIYIEAEENDPFDPVSHGERFAKIFDIDYGRCILCGLCVEACPTEALVMTETFETVYFNREEMVLTKKELLVSKGTPAKIAWLGYYRKGESKGPAMQKPYKGPFSIP